jgi:hypothetical protein
METMDLYQLVRSHHDDLRRLERPAKDAAERVLRGDPGADAVLREHTRLLHERLCAHTDVEDAELRQYLDRATGGPRWRAADIIRRHRTQRRWLDRVVRTSQGSTMATEELARGVRALLEVLFTELADEERQVLMLGERRLARREPRAPSSAASTSREAS